MNQAKSLLSAICLGILLVFLADAQAKPISPPNSTHSGSESIFTQPGNEASGPKESLTPFFEMPTKSTQVDFKPEELIAPLMPLTKKLPITLSSTNRRAYTHNKELAQNGAQESLELLHQKQFPWVGILLTIVCAIIWLLITYAPMPEKKESTHTLHPPLPPGIAALQEIDRLSDEPKGVPYFHALDKIIRNYLKQRYHVDFSAHTTPELVKENEVTKRIPAALKGVLIDFFKTNDKRKFAGYKPTSLDYHDGENEVRSLIERSENNMN